MLIRDRDAKFTGASTLFHHGKCPDLYAVLTEFVEH
jgi:hypothetical protein